MATAELIVAPRGDMVQAEDFLPVLSVDEAIKRKGMMNEFIAKVLREDEDYGAIPTTGEKKGKPTLLKPGAEKLCSIFGLTPQYIEDKIVEDWTGADHGGEPLFYYSYRCQLSRGGRFMGEAIGSCNSWESKYRYRWVRADQVASTEGLLSRGGKRIVFEPKFAIEKAETTGKYGKPDEYWQKFRDAMAAIPIPPARKKLGPKEYEGWEITVNELQYRIPNPDIADIINTCQKIAQKRALVDAVKVVTNCSDSFTQDLEDFEDERPTARIVDAQPASDGGWPFAEEEKPPVPPPATAHPLPMYRWQRLIPLEGVEVPDELSILFGSIDRDKDRNTAVTNALQVMGGCFAELNDAVAMKQHDEIRSQFRSYFAKGSGRYAKNDHIKGMLFDLWELLNKAKASKERGNGGI